MVDWIIRSLGAVVIVGFLSLSGGALEGYKFPVASGFDITRSESAGAGQTRVWGSFTIQRPRCNFVGLQWSLVGPARKAAAAIIFEEGTKVRDGGLNEFGPWLVQIDISQIEAASELVVFHQCPGRWWVTETRLFP